MDLINDTFARKLYPISIGLRNPCEPEIVDLNIYLPHLSRENYHTN